MPRHLALALGALALLAPPAVTAAARQDERAAEPEPQPAEAPAAARGPEQVTLRFAWPDPLESRVTYRRTRLRTGSRPSVFVARFEQRAEREGAGWRIATHGTRWEGHLPYPPAIAEEALRASEQVVQRIGPEGEFLGLAGAEAMRPALAHLFEEAKVPADQAERAMALAEAAARAEAQELWNLGVGFWIDAELELGEPYVMQTEAELPFLPGVRAAHAVEFKVRRRVPCSAGERARRCVEILLHATPDRAAVQRSAKALRAKLAAAAGEAAEGAARGELSAESELVLVTEVATLVPRRLVWTRSVRLGGGDREAPAAELVDRSEYDYRYPGSAPGVPARKKARAVSHR